MNNSQETQTKYKDEEVGAFWKRTSQRGQKYLAGHINMTDGSGESVKLVVFANNHKQNDNQPDYRIYKSRPRTEAVAAETKQEQPAVTEEDLL